MDCILCGCKLRKIDKFCSECGEITDSGRAVEALNKIGEVPPVGFDPLNQHGSIGWKMSAQMAHTVDEQIRNGTVWEADYGGSVFDDDDESHTEVSGGGGYTLSNSSPPGGSSDNQRNGRKGRQPSGGV